MISLFRFVFITFLFLVGLNSRADDAKLLATPSFESEKLSPSVDELMQRKMNLLNSEQKIEKIEDVVNKDVKFEKAEATFQRKNANSYTPLRDVDSKLIQATPPFAAEIKDPTIP